MSKEIPSEYTSLIQTLKDRFEKNDKRHIGISWEQVLDRLQQNLQKIRSLSAMEQSGGEPDVIGIDRKTGEIIFADCAKESPSGRRSLCYDDEALHSRKEHKPQSSAEGMAAKMGIELMSEEDYMNFQKLGPFDTKTSSWLKTPDDIRRLNGAIFGDYRYGRVFIYHNGASSYYAARGFRGMLKV